ncbi:MAG: RrF2 family transcriptional regulator [Thermodesulfobacteriota bacterium]
MKLSTRGRYGVRAVFDMAYYGQGRPAQIRSIAERQEIPVRYLEQILNRLRRAGIVKTVRGPKGGYFLGRSPSQITVADVVRATDGPVSLVKCKEVGRKDLPCHRAPKCVVKPVWEEASRRLGEYLESITIEQLCWDAEQKGL